jgi:hypothetical protein
MHLEEVYRARCAPSPWKNSTHPNTARALRLKQRMYICIMGNVDMVVTIENTGEMKCRFPRSWLRIRELLYRRGLDVLIPKRAVGRPVVRLSVRTDRGIALLSVGRGHSALSSANQNILKVSDVSVQSIGASLFPTLPMTSPM